MSQTNWMHYFNEKAERYGPSVKTSDYFSEKSFYMQRSSILKWLGNIKGMEILDAGCGVGAFSEPLVGENSVYGVDFSEKSLVHAMERGLKTCCADLVHLPFEDQRFDLVLCIGVIQLTENYMDVLKELARVTKKGGTMLIETLNKSSIQRKLLALVDRQRKFDRMYCMNELGEAYNLLGFKDVEYMRLYYPFPITTFTKGKGGMGNCLATSFAIKGVRA